MFEIGLKNIRVIERGSGIAPAYCGKLFADAGAEVIRVEPAGGDPLRRLSVSGGDTGEKDGALFQFLNLGKRSVAPDAGFDAAAMDAMIGAADLLIESLPADRIDPRALTERHPGLVVLSISPWGKQGPWSDRPATEFTLQAECGSIGARGLPGQEPFAAGGRITEWVSGTFAAVAGLAAVFGARKTGHGEWIDFSMLEAMAISSSNYMSVLFQLLGVPVDLHGDLMATVETPSIEPTADGYVGYCTNTRRQFDDFLLAIERPDLREDRELAQIPGRLGRLSEWEEIVHAHTGTRTTAELIECASKLRIPVAPVLDAPGVLAHEHLLERGVFRDDPQGRFRYPRPPYRVNGGEVPAAGPAPEPGQDNDEIEPHATARPAPSGEKSLPLAGIRILDCTSWWAGPSATHMLACLGAEVIHVESVQKPDGMRMVGAMMKAQHDNWWECSQFFLPVNANKRGITLNLSDERGLKVIEKLLSEVDAIVENFTPRVMDNFGLTWELVKSVNPRCVMVRMPAFGLDGPWRDRPGFAQTMEQLSGLAWVTGHVDDRPRIQRGPCDPLAGMHAAFSLLAALRESGVTGRGLLVESTMVEAALNAAAEQIIEFSAYGNVLERMGNRGPLAAPQGLYTCGGDASEAARWLALSVETEAQWAALTAVIGRPEWVGEERFATAAARRANHEALDAALGEFFARQEREEIVDALADAGVPAACVVNPAAIEHHPQMRARGFFESPEHPVVGRVALPTVPFRFAGVDRWLSSPAPMLGEHNREVLLGRLGLSQEEYAALEAAEIIGDRPSGPI